MKRRSGGGNPHTHFASTDEFVLVDDKGFGGAADRSVEFWRVKVDAREVLK